MSSYLSTHEFESRLIPGMKLKLRKMSSGRRASFNLKTAGIRAELDQARSPLSKLYDDRKIAKDNGDAAQLDSLSSVITVVELKIWNEIISTKLYRALVEWGVESVDGWDIDGQPVTVPLLLEKAPDEVIIEIGSKIDSVINMSFEEQMGFKLPSTSSAQVDGGTTGTDAPIVGTKEASSTAAGDVISIIQN